MNHQEYIEGYEENTTIKEKKCFYINMGTW